MQIQNLHSLRHHHAASIFSPVSKPMDDDILDFTPCPCIFDCEYALRGVVVPSTSPVCFADPNSHLYASELRERFANALPQLPPSSAPQDATAAAPAAPPLVPLTTGKRKNRVAMNRSLVWGHATAPVARIAIEKRYFIFSPSPADLIYDAKGLSKKLDSRYPNQRNIVVYKYACFSAFL